MATKNWDSELPHLERVWSLRSEQHATAAKDARKKARDLKDASPVASAKAAQDADKHERDAAAYKRRAETAADGYWPMHHDDTRDTAFQREYSELGNAAMKDGRAKFGGFHDEEERAGAQN